MELTGADILVRCLKDEGVKYIFGYPGGAALHIYDALIKQKDVQHILVRHEQAAAHAADGYARVTGEPGCYARYFRPWSNECRNWYCHSLHGFHAGGHDLRAGAHELDWR